MNEALPTHHEDIFSSGYDSSKDSEEDNNFNSPETNPENIFNNHAKENSDQLSTKILSFPFALDSYSLIDLKSSQKLELGGDELTVLFGNLDNFKNNELILKLEFVTKDRKCPLNLKEYKAEIESLINSDIEFVGIYENKLFIKYENETMTNDAYISLQKSSTVLDLLYEEENDFNISEDYSEKKNIKKTEEKSEQNKSINKVEVNNTIEKKNNIINKINNNLGENNNSNMNVKKNISPQNSSADKKVLEQQPKLNTLNPFFFPPQLLYNPLLFPFNNFQKLPPINPLLASQMSRTNPLMLQTALAFQNLMKLQQQAQNKNINNINICGNNNKNDALNNLKNINQFINNNYNNRINININKNNNLSPINNKESSTNSNSSSTSSKDSSPQMNYQSKSITNFKMESSNNDIIQKKIGDNLEEIVQNKQYKEYIPKKIKEKEQDVKFQTNSTRDYNLKYVSRYIVQIENEKDFPVTKMIIGNNGMLLRNILYNNCIKYGDKTTKIRLRGRGSGYKEGPKNEESKEPMELCISSLNLISFTNCSMEIEKLLQQIYYKYYAYQCKNYMENKKDKNINNNDNKFENNTPILMKKILRYHYIVNRNNTLIKEEKRRKKEEEMNKNKANENEKKNNEN